MEMYSPKSGDVSKFRLNVLKSDNKYFEQNVSNKREVKIQFEQLPKEKHENILLKAANSCIKTVMHFFI